MSDFRQLRVNIADEFGLHLRAASRLVQLTSQFQSEVRISCDGRAANGKSILDLMTLGAECGAWLEIEIRGPDALDASAALSKLLESQLH
jgi:phosphocarrier protein